MADPVAQKSRAVCKYMSDYPETLSILAKYWGKIEGSVTHAQMLAIDAGAATLSYTTKNSTEKKVFILPFNPPLVNHEDVKPRLLAMKQEAEVGLGVTYNPRITGVEWPSSFVYFLPAIGILLYTLLAPANAGPVWEPGARLREATGGTRVLCYTAIVVHSFESAYTYSLCRRHRTGFVLGLKYVLFTFILGMPVWLDLRKRIQAARMHSVKKID